MHATCIQAHGDRGSAENDAAGWERARTVVFAMHIALCGMEEREHALLCSAVACRMMQPVSSDTVKHDAWVRTVMLPMFITLGPATEAVASAWVPFRKSTVPPGGFGDPTGTSMYVPYPTSWPNVGAVLLRLTSLMEVVMLVTVAAAACPACRHVCEH